MPATEADLGTRKKCFTCNRIIECRKTEYNGETKYQWQNGDDEIAHYKFDQATKKASCRYDDSVKPKSNHLDSMDLSGSPPKPKVTRRTAAEMQKQFDAVQKDLEYPEIMQMRINATRDCELMGITEGVEIGAHINNVVRRLN